MNKIDKQLLINSQLLSNYKIIKKIGNGLTAEVYLAKCQKYGEVSIKAIQPSFYKSKLGYQLINNEVKILKDITHKYILKYLQNIQQNNINYIITEYCQGKNLQELIKLNEKISQKKALQILLKILQGCIYLKEKQIVHRDLKPSNIFIKNNQPIIADFGFAAYCSDEKLLKINAGSPLYMPFESLANKVFSQKSDVFALGVILVEMLTGKVPWQAQTQEQLKRKLKNPPPIPSYINNKIKNIIINCLAYQPNDRPNLIDLQKNIKNIYQTSYNKQKIVKKNQQVLQKYTKYNRSISFNIKSYKKYMEENKQNINEKNSGNNRDKSNTLYQPKKHRGNITTKGEKEKDSNLIHLLESLNGNDFTFLPSSSIFKFNTILNQYRQIVGADTQQNATPNYQQHDKLMIQVRNCKTQLQLCNKTEGFIRSLLRLTKSYKEHRNCLQKIQQLCTRVQLVIV